MTFYWVNCGSFYKEVSDSITNKALPLYFSKTTSNSFGVKVDDSLYMRSDWIDTMHQRILTSPLGKANEYEKAIIYFNCYSFCNILRGDFFIRAA